MRVAGRRLDQDQLEVHERQQDGDSDEEDGQWGKTRRSDRSS